MSNSVLRRAFWPPPFSEPIGAETVRVFRRFRLAALTLAILIDLLILATLRDSPYLDVTVVNWFAAVNLPILTLDFVLAWFFLRRPHRHYFLLQALALGLECLATVVWIQVTGSLSSYFLVVAFFYIVVLRVFLDYRTGVLVAVLMYSFHLGAFGLEELGVLDRVGLFRGDPGTLYAAAEYRYVAMLSISWCYMLLFAGVNLIVYRLRTTQAQLRRAENHLARVARGAAQGRLSGDMVGGYLLDELLGRGGMGEVYRGRRDSDGLVCAVKVLHPHLTDDPESLARFEHEALAVSRLPSRFVPEVLEIDTSGPECFIAMEYLQGEDLSALLRRRGRMDLAEVVILMTTLAEAVEAAHAAGVIHRDLKPRNVFLLDGAGATPVGRVRLLDFGISKLVDQESSLTMTSALLGSPGFMSPEQARGDSREVGPEADLFALGAIAYLALSGQRPFAVHDLPRALHALLYEEPVPVCQLVPELPETVDAVLAIALAKDPANRYRRPTDLAHDLANAASGTLDQEISERGRALLVQGSNTVTKTSVSRQRD